ncbi:RNA polymerase sigma factor [Limnoglobus roseus]|uniref:RNA polymerase sigma factor n=1 Tax=Limnoglobus roseus TaxID=2598579 RepID=A0A5C1A661_9BACT|nr:RNA polymerase sigma factor [Limnoglobus roseus]QEL14709.1 RNA polymerase sigma factor [Limnoglobus roseus]
MTALRIASLFAAPASVLSDDDRPDAELLAHFRATRDEVAFAVLVARHTPAIRAVCRSWLRSAADIDDATQATFLVLVQRLDSIRRPAALAAWLYCVAENVARRLRQQGTRAGPLEGDVPAVELVADDRGEVLAEEITKLPEKYRLPIQLCYVGGLSTADAARRLGCPTSTLVTRLARARERLQSRLAARGVVLAAVLTVTGSTARSVSPGWVWATAHAALAVLAGEPLNSLGVSERTFSLSQGVAKTMIWKNLKLIAAAAMIATGLVGFVIGQWATADGPKKLELPAAAKDKDGPPKPAAKADEGKPDPTPRRREAVIRMPAGSFVKDVEVNPYGHGRITWNYDDDRVTGLIEGNVMGVEFEIETEAEVSLSSNGTIYGVVTSAKVTHLKANGELGAEIGEYAKFFPLVEPLINEMFTDLPFSYQFRVKNDRLTILSYRALMAGPNPLTKFAALGGDSGLGEIAGVMLYFQAFSTALEGTYVSAEAAEKQPKKRPVFRKPLDAGKSSPLTAERVHGEVK